MAAGWSCLGDDRIGAAFIDAAGPIRRLGAQVTSPRTEIVVVSRRKRGREAANGQRCEALSQVEAEFGTEPKRECSQRAT